MDIQDAIVAAQKKRIAELELSLLRLEDRCSAMRQKHSEINNQIIQANVSFQQSVSDANRQMRILGQEKDEIFSLLADERANTSVLKASNAALEGANKVLQAQNKKILDMLQHSLGVPKETEAPTFLPPLPKEISQSDFSTSQHYQDRPRKPKEKLKKSPKVAKKLDIVKPRQTRRKQTKNYAEPSLRSKLRRNEINEVQ